MIRVRRNYRAWVANETLEDYSLRYAARSYRRLSPFLLANTALGGISFLALEAIGGAITVSYGFANALPAVLLVCTIIFLTGLPITYYAARYNVDIDLLTRGAGFGYIGSTVTSLIYASFTFIFFALEAAIMAQALQLYFGLPMVMGYVVSSLVIIPITFFGVTLISRLQLWTQPLWALLLLLPFVFILAKEPAVLSEWAHFSGRDERGGSLDLLLLGAATGVLCSLVPQIGEQVDYLRFLPDRTPQNRRRWWAALVAAGPGWILLGGAKVLAGGLLAWVLIRDGSSLKEAVEPTRMYIKAYDFVFDEPEIGLAVAMVFVLVSQVKINVTNAYAGSLAWANFFSRVTHYHPGRVIWLVFNVLIALLLMLLGIFETLETVLSVYSNVAIAWIGAIVADLVVLKPLRISPPFIEFKRAHLHHVNPVGCGAMLVASVLSIAAFAGLLGEVLGAYSALVSLVTAFVCAVAIGVATRGRYYLARADRGPRALDEQRPDGGDTVRCCTCERSYEAADMAFCPFYDGNICSLCCSLDTHCHDICKQPAPSVTRLRERGAPALGQPVFAPNFGRRVGRFAALFSVAALIAGAVFLLSYRLLDVEPGAAGLHLEDIFLRLYAGSLALLAIGTWWLVLSHESHELAESELVNSLHHLELTQRELVESEKMASLGGLVAGVAHEINTPVGITISAASFLQERAGELREALARSGAERAVIEEFLADAEESSRLVLANATRAANLVNSFKRVAVDRTSEERRSFDLRQYLEETLESLRPQLRCTPHRLVLECPAGIRVDGYPGALAQVIANLVLNALSHAFDSGQAGTIRIDAGLGRDEAGREDDSRLVLRCSDDGRGIPDAIRGKVFEPFFTTRRGQGGSGLGLHLVYNIVSRTLDGSVRVESALGGGSSFIVEFPRVASAAGGAITQEQVDDGN